MDFPTFVPDLANICIYSTQITQTKAQIYADFLLASQ